MKRYLLMLAVIAAFATSAHADETDAMHIRALLANASAPSVIVRAVLHVEITQNGQSQQQEGRAELAGVFVDPSGLVMVTDLPFKSSPGGGASGSSYKITPSDFKVVMPPDSAEHPATMVATDDELGVAFLQVSDLAGKAVPSVNFSDSDNIEVGADMLQLNRLERGFDFAPFASLGLVIGEIQKPRHAFITAGASRESGLPVYDNAGKPVGLVINITAAAVADAPGVTISNHEYGETMSNGKAGEFLIPAKDVAAVIAKALARAAAATAAPSAPVTH